MRLIESAYHVEEVPVSIESAKKSKDWPNWRKAIEEELTSMKCYETWDLVES